MTEVEQARYYSELAAYSMVLGSSHALDLLQKGEIPARAALRSPFDLKNEWGPMIVERLKYLTAELVQHFGINKISVLVKDKEMFTKKSQYFYWRGWAMTCQAWLGLMVGGAEGLEGLIKIPGKD